MKCRVKQEKPTKNPNNLQTVDKAFELLDILAEHPEGLTCTQLEAKAGLNRSKTFRLLATLCERGMAEREAVTGSYRLGVCSLALAQKCLKNASLISYAHPVMEELARKHDEAVYMTVVKNEEVVFLDMVDCGQHIKASSLVGRKFPLFSNAAGKAMKALDSRDLLEKLHKKRGRRRTGLDLERLSAELDEIRSRGVAVDRGALGEGISSVAVAIRDYAGKVVGAITLLGPSFRMLTERLENEIIPSMIEGAEILSEKFGYAPA